MSAFQRPDLEFKPNKIYNDNIKDLGYVSVDQSDPIQSESEDVVNRLLDHVAIIKEFNDRLDTIDYLTKNAESLAKNPTYTTNNQDIINAILALDGNGNSVDFALFKKAVDIIIQNFNNMAITALAGTNT